MIGRAAFAAVFLWAAARGIADALARRPDLEGRLAEVMAARRWRETDRAIRDMLKRKDWLIWGERMFHGGLSWGPDTSGWDHSRPRFHYDYKPPEGEKRGTPS